MGEVTVSWTTAESGRRGEPAGRRTARGTLPRRDHPPVPTAELLDHRAHRSREVHAGGPAARDDPHDRRPPDDEPGPRLDGSREGEGDHDQGARGAPRVHGRATASSTASTSSTRRVTSTSRTRSAAASRRARARSSWSTRRRASRPRRWPTSTSRCARASRSSRSSTRSTCRRPSPSVVMEELENVLAIPREEVILASRQGGHAGSPEILEAIVARVPPPKGDPTKRAPGARLRLALRPLQGRARATSGSRRARSAATTSSGSWRAAPRRSSWSSACSARSSCRSSSSWRARSGYVATGLKNVREAQVGDTVTTVAKPAAEPLPGLPGGEEPRVRGPVPAERPGLPAAARRAREAPPQRRVVHVRAGELGRARASGSAAASSGCSTWRSSRSASSASSTSTSSRPRRRSSTASS